MRSKNYQEKKVYPCNLLKLREELKLTQKELGNILDVSTRMISNYEISETTLPIEKAILLCEKYNYTLDWIYCFPIKPKDTNDIINKKEYPSFIADIRNFISRSDDTIFFTIPDYYWKYIKERNAITSSKSPEKDKKRKIAELNAAFCPSENEQKYWRFSIEIDNFLPHLRFDSKFIPFVDNLENKSREATKEEMEELTTFFETLESINDNADEDQFCCE